MLSILVLSHKGEGYEVANRLKHEGHVVKLWEEQSSGRFESGLCGATEINRYQDHLETADLVVALSPGVGRTADRIRKGGRLVVGGGIQNLLEDDPGFILCTAKLLGFELQPPPEGQDLILCGWFNGTDWIETYLVQEYTRLLDRSRGPRTEGMGYVTKKHPELLVNLNSFLASSDYRGFLGVKVVWAGGKLFFNGFITQLNGGLMASIVECTQVRLSDHLYATASGTQGLKRPSDHTGQAVRILAFDHNTQLRLTENASKHVWAHREDESLGFVSAGGDSLREARRRCYRTVSNVCTIDTVYRSDVGFTNIHDDSEVINALKG